MLKIRLQRIGKKGQAYFRVIVTEHTQKPKGRFLELLGTYDHHADKVNVKKDSVIFWLSKGAQASPTVNNLLAGRKIIEGKKVKTWKAKKKVKGKEEQAVKVAPEEKQKEVTEVIVEKVSVIETPAEQPVATP